MGADAVCLTGQARHFVQLPKIGKAAPLLAIANDLEAMAPQAVDAIQILGGRGVEVDHVWLASGASGGRR